MSCDCGAQWQRRWLARPRARVLRSACLRGVIVRNCVGGCWTARSNIAKCTFAFSVLFARRGGGHSLTSMHRALRTHAKHPWCQFRHWTLCRIPWSPVQQRLGCQPLSSPESCQRTYPHGSPEFKLPSLSRTSSSSSPTSRLTSIDNGASSCALSTAVARRRQAKDKLGGCG